MTTFEELIDQAVAEGLTVPRGGIKFTTPPVLAPELRWYGVVRCGCIAAASGMHPQQLSATESLGELGDHVSRWVLLPATMDAGLTEVFTHHKMIHHEDESTELGSVCVTSSRWPTIDWDNCSRPRAVVYYARGFWCPDSRFVTGDSPGPRVVLMGGPGRTDYVRQPEPHELKEFA